MNSKTISSQQRQPLFQPHPCPEPGRPERVSIECAAIRKNCRRSAVNRVAHAVVVKKVVHQAFFGQQVSGSTSRSRHISPIRMCLLWPSFYAPGQDVQSYERFHGAGDRIGCSQSGNGGAVPESSCRRHSASVSGESLITSR